MDYKEPNIVAELCCNHQGSIDLAKRMIKVAAESKVTVIKLQKRNNKEFLTTEQYNTPHPNKMHSFGEPYGQHREFLEFDLDQNKQLMNYCKEIGIEYSTSVWDVHLQMKLYQSTLK